MRRGVTLAHALRVLWLGTVFGRCPSCLSHSMFCSFIKLYERCPQCGIRYQRESGAWLGAPAIGYGFGAVFGVAFALIEERWHPVAYVGLDPLWTIAIVSLLVTIPAYRPAKGFWFALLWLYEFTDDAPA